MIAEGEGEQYMSWSHQESKLADGGKWKGMIIASGFTNSQKFSWMNTLLMVGESESNPATQQFRVTGYEWI
jgi:hypothetical protein